ncbi:hypothetical protein BB559_005378, partial [Furculomyces boomerangus]
MIPKSTEQDMKYPSLFKSKSVRVVVFLQIVISAKLNSFPKKYGPFDCSTNNWFKPFKFSIISPHIFFFSSSPVALAAPKYFVIKFDEKNSTKYRTLALFNGSDGISCDSVDISDMYFDIIAESRIIVPSASLNVGTLRNGFIWLYHD